MLYLRYQDFNTDGSLKCAQLIDKIVVVMIKANFCGYCKLAFPEFLKAEKLLDKNKFVFAAILCDGNVIGERECMNIVPKITYDFMGFPDYAIFYKNKPLKREIIIKRDHKSIVSALLNNKHKILN